MVLGKVPRKTFIEQKIPQKNEDERKMRKTFEDNMMMVFEGDEKRVVITRNEYNNSKFLHYSVFVKEGNKKGKTVATRCTIEAALSFTK